MDPIKLRDLLERVGDGSLKVDAALEALSKLPYADLGYATVDHHRALRQGTPEVIYGEPKTAAQIVGIAREIVDAGQNVLVTRLEPEKAEVVCRQLPQMHYSEVARVATCEVAPIDALDTAPVAVVTAGTSDIPVAQEALETLRMLGIPGTGVFDVGVAGIHRVFGRLDTLTAAPAVIVVAGMEGALPSVVGGLIGSPIIAVPTSVGYGVSLGGMTALFGILSSCAAGVLVVNIDNGFGAAMAVARIVRGGRAG